MIFMPDYLILDDSTAVALKFVESMRFPDGEDHTFAKLKDDPLIEIIMCSGKQYTVSTRAQFNENDYRIKEDGIDVGRSAIFDKWKNTLRGK